MKRFNKILGAFLIIIVGLLFLSGCGSSTPATTPSQTDPTKTVLPSPTETVVLPTYPNSEKVIVIFEIDGEAYSFVAVLVNDFLEEPDAPTKDFYIFEGWYLGEEQFNFEDPVTENLVLEAKWEDDDHLVIDYVIDDELIYQHKQKLDELIVKPEDPFLAGFEFVGWELDGEVYDFSQIPTTNLTLTAVFEEALPITVSFVTNNGEVTVPAQELNVGELASMPELITHDNQVIAFWTDSNSGKTFNFKEAVTESVELEAYWVSQEIYADIEDILNNADSFASGTILDLPARGAISNSRISWSSTSKYISKSGVVMPLLYGEEAHYAPVTGRFRLDAETVEFDFFIEILPQDKVELTVQRNVEFTSLTTEYEVEPGSIDLFFEEDGSVPYVNLVEFLQLVTGFIDDRIEFKVSQTENRLVILYEYYDEREDHIYDLMVSIDALNNTISTNDPGFFWAYVKSTKTNYARHIEYMYEHPDNHSIDGLEVVYDLSKYNLEITKFNDQIVLPLYVVNQLFVGSSYYNVYYNYDDLYGIYSLPREGDSEYNKIKESTKNKTTIPSDLLFHTINTLAFDMDYFYGLREIMNIDTFYDYIFDRKDSILTASAKSFDEGLFDIIVKDLDEPHTSFGYPSYFNDKSWSGPSIQFIGQFGDRMKDWYNNGLYAMDDAIEAKWGRLNIASNAWAASSKSRPDYWFLDDTHAVVTLDGFVTSDIYENNVHDNKLINEIAKASNDVVLLPNIDGGEKYFYFNNSTQKLDILEILIKGLTEEDLTKLNTDLVAFGYKHTIEESSDFAKKEGYYTNKIDGKNYFVVTTFDAESGLLYLGLAVDKAPSKYTSSWPVTAKVSDLIESDSAVRLEMLLEKLFEEKPTIEYISLDLTWNMGGNVGALYRIVGFITDQPFKVSSIDETTKRQSTTHIIIDGVPNYSHINWSLLTSKVTFSAANSLATIFKQNNLGPIVGTVSGGGAASITPILLPNGTAFTMSSNSVSAYTTGTGTEEDPYVYHDNEYGITPDYILTPANVLKVDKLLDVFNEHYDK